MNNEDHDPDSGETPDPTPSEASQASDPPAPSSPTPKARGRKKSAEAKGGRTAEIELLRAGYAQASDEAEAARSEAERQKREVEDLRDKHLRALADMENLRKRLEREKGEFFQFALTDILRELLSVVDNFDRALKTEDADGGGGFREGVELIRKQFGDILLRRGVTLIERPDGKFDPAVHQALVTEDVEGIEDPMVGEELQKGYRLHDRLLRPALVKVLLPKKN